MSGTRPDWGFKELREADFRAIFRLSYVKQVRSAYAMTSADTADEWIEAAGQDGIFHRIPRGWAKVWSFVGHNSVPGLFKLNYLGEQMAARLKEIDSFEKRESADRLEYERLKAKFNARDVRN